MRYLLLLLLTAACTTGYPTALETLAVFEKGEVKTCNDALTPILKNLVSDGWQIGKPVLKESSMHVPLIKGSFTKLVLIVSAAARWDYPKRVEHLGLCVSGKSLGYVVVDTFKTDVSQHIEPKEDNNIIQM